MEYSNILFARVSIPHFYCENEDQDGGYGSSRSGSRLNRSIALFRCIESLRGLRRRSQDLTLDLVDRSAQYTPPLAMQSSPPLTEVELHLHVTGSHYLDDVLALLEPSIHLHHHDLEDSRQLALVARDYLLSHPQPMDLNLYLEDDLVIHDQWFFEKILWMAEQSDQRCVLLPHRYELLRTPGAPPRLFVDGHIDPDEIVGWHQHSVNVAQGSFHGMDDLSFDAPVNPHAGCFAVSRLQQEFLRSKTLPVQGFVGPLETAATFTVGRFFTILKPALANRDFLTIEHAHPSFLGYVN